MRIRRISMATRGELIVATAERYGRGNRAERGRILDEFAAVTGYHRKHAMRLLRAGRSDHRTSARSGRRIYDAARPKIRARQKRQTPDPFGAVSQKLRGWFEAVANVARTAGAITVRTRWQLSGRPTADIATSSERMAARDGASDGIWNDARCRTSPSNRCLITHRQTARVRISAPACHPQARRLRRPGCLLLADPHVPEGSLRDPGNTRDAKRLGS
jgi:hypothetical protein